MMKKLWKKFADITEKYLKACYIGLLLIVIGCIAGNMVAHFIDEDRLSEVKEAVSYIFEGGHSFNTDKMTLFFQSLKEYTFSFVFILVCSFSVWFVPLLFGKLIYNGFCVGLSSGIIVRLFGMKVFFCSWLWLFIKNFFYIPILVAVSVYAIDSAVKKKRKSSSGNKSMFKNVVCEMVFLLCVSALCGFMESVVGTGIMLRII